MGCTEKDRKRHLMDCEILLANLFLLPPAKTGEFDLKSRVGAFFGAPLQLLNSFILYLIRWTKPVVDFASFLVNQEVTAAVVEVEVQVRLW